MNATLNIDTNTQLTVVESRYPGVLSFQKLRDYQRSIEFLALVIEVIAELPKGHAELADQLLRAAQSQPAQHR